MYNLLLMILLILSVIIVIGNLYAANKKPI